MSIKINNDTANGSSTLQPNNTATGDVVHTLPAFTTELAPRMQLGTAVASTSGTSIDFTGIPSWAKKITVMFNGVSTSGASVWQVQIGSGSVQTGGYVATSNSGGAFTGLTTGFPLYINNSSFIVSGAVSILSLNSNIFIASGFLGITPYTGGTVGVGGGVTLSGTLDRIRITTVDGTDIFDAGTVNILIEG